MSGTVALPPSLVNCGVPPRLGNIGGYGPTGSGTFVPPPSRWILLYSPLGPGICGDTTGFPFACVLAACVMLRGCSGGNLPSRHRGLALPFPSLTPWSRPLRYFATTIVAPATVRAASRGDDPDLEGLGGELQLVRPWLCCAPSLSLKYCSILPFGR